MTFVTWLAQALAAGASGLERASAWALGTTEGTTYAVSRWLFLRALGVVYLIAFLSFWVQAKGLMGSGGIEPVATYLDGVGRYLGSARYRLVPTVFWLDASDRALSLACGAGVLCAALLICDVAPVAALAGLWVLYLSIVSVGQDFLAFQWDALLLEAGFLAIWVAPTRLWPGSASTPVSATILVLLWWLLFRLTFQSGLVKLTWGDPTWRNLSALDFHFYTQPLPTWTAWYAQQVPEWCKRSAAALTLVLEIVVPLAFFGPRPVRLGACVGAVFLQVAIFATGNYTFFNLLAVALALLLVDDASWAALLPHRLQALVGTPGLGASVPGGVRSGVAVVVFALSCGKFWLNSAPGASLPAPALKVLGWADPFRSINSYGLFRVMTTSRSEIVVEGSDDGVTWRPYGFRYKPGDPKRRPAFVEPHQPRLDWQMWFAALSGPQLAPWFGDLLGRLLEGSPAVLGLLGSNPFPDHPPRFVRAELYDYRFTDVAEGRASGAWWVRTRIGPYMPPVSLQGPGDGSP